MLKTYQPQSSLLQHYIDFFYVFNRDVNDQISYIAFPHTNTAISFFKGAEIQRGNYELTISTNNQHREKFHIEILGKYTQPVFVNYIGKCEEVAIVFKPLGVNHFFQNHLIELSPAFSQELTNSEWRSFSQQLMNENSLSEKFQLLENFLIDEWRALDDRRIEISLHLLEDTEINYSIEYIAEECGYSIKTLQRNFIKHLTCTPSEYKRIARFRHALQSKIISKELRSLTSLSLSSNYYDQSYFIREFKKLTQLSPKSFFESITAMDEKNIIWKVK